MLPPETVVPPFMVYGGNPGECTGELPPSTQEVMAEATRGIYQHFKPTKKTNNH